MSDEIKNNSLRKSIKNMIDTANKAVPKFDLPNIDQSNNYESLFGSNSYRFPDIKITPMNEIMEDANKPIIEELIRLNKSNSDLKDRVDAISNKYLKVKKWAKLQALLTIFLGLLSIDDIIKFSKFLFEFISK